MAEQTDRRRQADGIVPGSVDDIVRRLERWCRLAPSGIARVEFSSEPAREAVVQKLQTALKQSDIQFAEIRLTPSSVISDIVGSFLEALSILPNGVAFVSGFEAAFQTKVARPAEMTASEWIWQLNFNRETLTSRPLRQIWWMTPGMAARFSRITPDIDSWFSPKLALTEHFPFRTGDEFEVVINPHFFRAARNADEARAEAGRLIERFRKAAESGVEPDELYRLAVSANQVLTEAGLTREAEQSLEDATRTLADLGLDISSVSADIAGSTLTELANQLVKQGRYADAEPLYQRAIAVAENVTGDNRPFDEAESLYKQGLGIQEEKAGLDPLLTARIYSDLGTIYGSKARYNDAMSLFERALEIRTNMLAGNQGPDVAYTLMNIANLLTDQSRYSEAEPLLIRALSIDEAVLGPEHPDIALILINLSAVYIYQGRGVEAIPLIRRAIAVEESALGPNHPDVAFSLTTLANAYADVGIFQDAEPLYLRALSIQEIALGRNHPELALTLLNLGIFYARQGSYHKAEHFVRQALDIQGKVLGHSHPLTIDTSTLLARVSRDVGRDAVVGKIEGSDTPQD